MPIGINGSGTITGISAGGLPDSVIVADDIASGAVTQVKLGTNVTGNGPTFLISQTGSQTIANTTATVLQINNEIFDIGGCYNNTGSTTTLNGLSVPAWAFMPNIAGYYQINNQVIVASNTGVAQAYIFKNGSPYIFGAGGVTDGGNCLSTASAVIYFNGTTDYIQSGVWQNSGTTKSVTTGTNFNTFSGALVRAA